MSATITTVVDAVMSKREYESALNRLGFQFEASHFIAAMKKTSTGLTGNEITIVHNGATAAFADVMHKQIEARAIGVIPAHAFFRTLRFWDQARTIVLSSMGMRPL